MMFQFIYWLKTAAAVLITNSHYADIWPISSLAAGGHLGNCIFFLVSGFCLFHVNASFPKWYAKRIFRIYPVLWFFTIVNILAGFFKVEAPMDVVRYLIYPTDYHFVASIMVLYALYYLWRKTRMNTRSAIVITVIVYVVAYLFCFDKSWYHIDAVEENWVRFQFWASMLLGAGLREKNDEIDSRISAVQWAGLAFLFVAYFAGKVAFGRYQSLSIIQCFLPVLLVILTYVIALTAIKLEKQGFFATKTKLNKIMQFVAAMTLEIYLGQHVIIKNLSPLPFPVDFLIVTTLIVVYAWAVHWFIGGLQNKCAKRKTR